MQAVSIPVNMQYINCNAKGLTSRKFTYIMLYVKNINHLNTKRRQLYLKTQFVLRSKHFSSRL